MSDVPFEPEGDLDPDTVVEIPVDGILDLHTFSPADVKVLVPDYVDECRRRGILEIRIIHGKGTGTLRRLVHHLLEQHPAVVSFHTPSDGGSWGATVAVLEP